MDQAGVNLIALSLGVFGLFLLKFIQKRSVKSGHDDWGGVLMMFLGGLFLLIMSFMVSLWGQNTIFNLLTMLLGLFMAAFGLIAAVKLLSKKQEKPKQST